MKAAYPGIEGTFAHQACELMLPDHQPCPHPTFEAAAAAVASGEADAGLMPLHNNIAGEVPGVRGLLERRGLIVTDRRPLAIELHLLGLPGCRLEEVERVSSHPMAFRQCTRRLSELGLILVESTSTAEAARGLAERSSAALASAHAAALYGLDILMSQMTDRAGSETIFGVVRRSSDTA